MAHHVKPAPKPTQSHGAISIGNPSENHPSNNLWIGSVMPDVTDSELKALFENYGEVLGVNSYPSRNFAFVYFKEMEAAKSARQGLQGHVLHGNRLKIDFAKPARPCNSLWVARISKSVTKEELEKEFLRFGPIKEVRFLRDRNTAYIDYIRLEDATQALRSMNGKRIGGDPIRVDFLRSQYLRREQGSDAKQVQLSSRTAEDSLPNYPQPSLAGTDRQNQLPTDGLGKPQSECNSMWRGIIAKGGIPICRARCVPIGEGIDTHMPEVINCSERTRLDSLRKHCDNNAIGFSTVYFLPDSEQDFASYMEFTSYLVCKDRAGVIKFDDGTTLFLVPSNFLSKVLQVPGPECLYGVVLKFPEPVSSSASENHRSTQNPDPRVVHPKSPSPVSSCLQEHSVRPTAKVSLPRVSSTLEPQRNVVPGLNIDVAHWKHERTLDHNHHIVQQLGRVHNLITNLPPQGAISSEPLATVNPAQSGPQTVAPVIKYERGSSQDNLWGQFCGSNVSKPIPYMSVPRLECENQSQQLRTDPRLEIQKSTEVDAEKIARYNATLSWAAYILSQRNQLPDNQPGTSSK